MPGTPDATGRAAELGRSFRARQALTDAELAEVQSAPHAFAVEVAVGGYWPTEAVPLLLDRGPDCVPAIDAHATRALDRRPRPFEGTILLWARHALTGAIHPPAFDALLDRDLGPTAPAPKIAAATRALLEALPIARREPLVLDGPSPRWAWIGTCPTRAVAEAAVAALGRLRSTIGNARNPVEGAAALGPTLRPLLEAALNHELEGYRPAWTAVLAKLVHPDARPTLESLTGDPDPDVRAWARSGLTALDRPDFDPTDLSGLREDGSAERWVAHFLAFPPDGYLPMLLGNPLLPAAADAVSRALAPHLGAHEASAHDAHLFDWLAREAVWTDRAVYERGLEHPDPRVRAVCRHALDPVAPEVPADPFEALPGLLADAMAPCRWGGFECRLYDRDAERLYAHSNELEDPPATPVWVDRGHLDEPDLVAIFAATPHDELRADVLDAVPASWDRARATLDRIYASERTTHLGTEIDAALDRLIAAFQALDLQPLAIDHGVYRVAYDEGIALRSDRYLGVYWYLNDQ